MDDSKDIRDYLKEEVKISTKKIDKKPDNNVAVVSVSEIDNKVDLKKILGNGYRKICVFLDTDIMEFQPDGKLRWEISKNKVTTELGTISLHINNLNRIVGCKLGPTRLALAPNTYTRDPRYRWTFLIEEFKTDSFIHSAGRRFHTIQTGSTDIAFDDTQATSYVETLIGDEYMFKFGFYDLQTITISMGSPFNVVPIPGQRSLWKVDQQSNPMHLELHQTIYPYELTTEDVIITGFTTGDTVTDSKTIDSINGQELTITSASSTDIYIGSIDLSSTTSTGGDLFVVVKSKRYRQIIPLQLYYTTKNITKP